MVPCTTSTGPTNLSMEGRSKRRHRACSGRAGIGRCRLRTPEGSSGRDEPAPAPAHRIGLHLEPGPDGQRGEGTLTEGADTGGLPEQRRRIERDPEPCGLGAPARVDAAQVVIAPSMERMAPVM